MRGRFDSFFSKILSDLAVYCQAEWWLLNNFDSVSILRGFKFHFKEFSFQDSLTWKDYKAKTCRQVYDDSFDDRTINEIF